MLWFGSCLATVMFPPSLRFLLLFTSRGLRFHPVPQPERCMPVQFIQRHNNQAPYYVMPKSENQELGTRSGRVGKHRQHQRRSSALDEQQALKHKVPQNKPADKTHQPPQAFHRATGLQRVEGSCNSRYQVVLAKAQVIQRQPGPKCPSTDVTPAAPETQPLQLSRVRHSL